MPTQNGKCYMPFKNIDKKVIKELYEKFNVLKDLFPLTRSCEEFRFCAERFWGFGRYV